MNTVRFLWNFEELDSASSCEFKTCSACIYADLHIDVSRPGVSYGLRRGKVAEGEQVWGISA